MFLLAFDCFICCVDSESESDGRLMDLMSSLYGRHAAAGISSNVCGIKYVAGALYFIQEVLCTRRARAHTHTHTRLLNLYFLWTFVLQLAVMIGPE